MNKSKLSDKPIFPWDDRGDDFRIPAKTAKTNGYTMTDGTAHAVVRRDTAKNGFWVRMVLCWSGRKRIDEDIFFTHDEFLTAFDAPHRRCTVTDPEFAREFGADYGVRGKFVVKGSKLNLVCFKDGVWETLSIRLKPGIRHKAERFAQAGAQIER